MVADSEILEAIVFPSLGGVAATHITAHKDWRSQKTDAEKESSFEGAFKVLEDQSRDDTHQDHMYLNSVLVVFAPWSVCHGS